MTELETLQTAKNFLPLKQAEWLHKAIEILREDFRQIGETLPDINIRVEYPYSDISYNWLGTYQMWKDSWLGTWEKTRYPDEHIIFINPSVDGLMALDILVHELVHAVGIPDHGERFLEIASAIGLDDGGITAGAEGVLLKRLREIHRILGNYPLVTDLEEA